MSTTFGILTQYVEHEKVVDEDGNLLWYISHNMPFEPVWFRGVNSRWLNNCAKFLPDETKVYAIDNKPQGIFTIGDIKKCMKDNNL